ncbi:MAG: GrpE-domain-containing protein [Benjaminiella poitrasii]|nr:MAG: GrpE-domain-containing protein [Benjaminiella poitrasii]
MLKQIIHNQTKARLILPLGLVDKNRGFLTCSVLKAEETNTTADNNMKEDLQEKTISPEEELKEVSLKLKELQSSYLLALADQENLRQRNIREVANAKDYAIQKFAKDLLDPVDILDMALDAVPEGFREKETCLQKDKKDIVEQLVNLYTGLSITKTQLQKTLAHHHVQLDDPIDQKFDPNKHEAVFQTSVPDKDPGTIFVVQKKGYMLKNRVLRPAQVGVVSE